ncbi:MAG: tetratricopeptide repeat protein, partial [Candidatus Nanopelagicaceae bacterium]
LVFRWQQLCQVSADLAAVLEKMVAPQVSDRYRDGMAVAEVIEKLSITPPSSAKVKQQPPVTTPASTLILDGSHKFLKSLMIGGAGLFGMFLLISVFSLVKTLLPKTPIINNSSTDGSSLSSSTTPSLTANNGNNDTKSRDDQKLSESELENKKKEIAGYDKTISINSQDADAYLKRGIAKFKLGNTQEAMDDFNKAISLAPKDARAYGVRGAAKLQSGNKQEAIDDYNKAISLDT